MEFGKEADRPTYIGMSKTLTGPFLIDRTHYWWWIGKTIRVPKYVFDLLDHFAYCFCNNY